MFALTSTIKDVATRAGVSVATVSRVINRLGGVKPDTELRISKAMEDLHYVPNVLARSVKSQKTRLISMIIPDIRNPFFAAVYTGASEVARNASYTTLLGDSGDNEDLEEALLRTSMEHRASGLVLTPVHEKPVWFDRVQLDSPVCLVDRMISGYECDRVLLDNRFGAYEAVRLLTQSGHTRIGLIAGPLDSTPGKQRFEGFVEALSEAGLKPSDELIKIGDFKEGSGYQLTMELLELQHPPTAILSSNNLMTMGMLEAINASGVQIGKDISVVGFDDIPIATLMSPKLTVVSRPMKEMGEAAMRLLLERIDHPDKPVREIVMRPSLIVRGSEILKR